MEQLLLKAATTATDEGVFEAVISTANPDRDGDVVEPSAMVDALSKWASLSKLVPLAWAHTSEIVGSVDPATVAVSGSEVTAKGRIDQSTQRGQETWRLVKSGTLSFSFGYLIPKGGATKRTGGRYHITNLDVFEISVVPVGPANNDTRVLAWKAIASPMQMADRMRSMAAEMESANPPDPKAMAARMHAMADEMANMGKSAETLRAQAQHVARQVEQDRIADVPGEAPEPNPLVDALGAVKEMTPVTLADALDDLDVNGTRFFVRLIDTLEHEGVKTGEIKAVWSTAYINNLPDSAFLYIEPGGSKDAEGKTTPRSLRHFPYKDAEGNVDLPHLRNALSRIPQSRQLSDTVKEELTRKAQQILDNQKSVDVTGERSVDPLRKRSEDLALEVSSGGMSLRTPPSPVKAPPAKQPSLELGELKARSRDLMLQVLSGIEET